MKKGRKKYIVLIVIAFLLTPTVVNEAYEMRQALHFGGEWLLIPLAILVGLVIDSFKEILGEVKKISK